MKAWKLVLVAVVALTGFLQGCNYSKGYFRVGPDGEMVPAESPLSSGESPGGGSEGETSGGGSGSATGGTTGDGTGTGEEVVIPEDPEAPGADPATPLYSLIYKATDRATQVPNLYATRLANALPLTLEAPKPLTTYASNDDVILYAALSPDGSKVLYKARPPAGGSETQYRLITDVTGTPQNQILDIGESTTDTAGVSWTRDGDEAIFVTGGCGLMRRAKIGGPAVVTVEAEEPAGSYDDWAYSQTSPSMVTDAADPTYNSLVFGMFSRAGAATQGFDLFLKGVGDVDQSHYQRLTNTPGVFENLPSLSPDGRHIAFVTTLHDDPAAPRTLSVCDMDFSGAAPQCLNARNFGGLPAGSQVWNACWSWDKGKLFFTAQAAAGAQYDLFSVDFTQGAFGASATNLTNTEGIDEMDVSCASVPLTQ